MPPRAKKSLGQNFLRDEQVVDRIVAALDLDKGDEVVEIGPGQGALTEKLIEHAGRVTAIEFDRDLIESLNERFRDSQTFHLINADVLTFEFADLTGPRDTAKLKLVANLPYNISTPILQRLIDARGHFSRIVLMFQREVVERITAPPGGKERGYLSVLVENAFATEYLFDVPPDAFYPVPKVWSGVVRLTPQPPSTTDDSSFSSFLSTAFAHKRKTIFNNLKAAYPNVAQALTAADIDPKRRAETLTLDEWKFLLLQIAQD
jgi:16S rRNA (adenine1518-N6/adenine1519-N6)-dimethyltransferase